MKRKKKKINLDKATRDWIASDQSAGQLARAAGVSLKTITRIRRGEGQPRRGTAAKLLRAAEAWAAASSDDATVRALDSAQRHLDDAEALFEEAQRAREEVEADRAAGAMSSVLLHGLLSGGERRLAGALAALLAEGGLREVRHALRPGGEPSPQLPASNWQRAVLVALSAVAPEFFDADGMPK